MKIIYNIKMQLSKTRKPNLAKLLKRALVEFQDVVTLEGQKAQWNIRGPNTGSTLSAYPSSAFYLFVYNIHRSYNQ